MICSRCGANLPDNATACPHCVGPNPEVPQGPPLPGYAPPGYGPPPPGYVPPGYAPPPGYYAPLGYGPVPNIPDYLVWSIITTLCCQPFGIAAIIFSVMAIGDKDNGRYDSAMKNSRTAKKMVLIGLIIWAVAVLFYAAISILAVVIAIFVEK